MSDNPTQSAIKSTKPTGNRRKSRELALKGLYQLLLSPKELRLIVREMADEADFARADETYFRSLLEGVYDQIPELDHRIAQFLDRPISELSPIEHAILLISAYELIFDVSIPYRVAINEGVELAKLYGGTDGHKYVNGVLDKLAAAARPSEVSR
ncbi:transcription antitermination factor NusB [Candidatus Methylopumilus turicensis]|uniref:Transcription antitermination protein NusB n=1 Tax=Candidatus Methylopumilus turicensis TaxID=1581680 RepID=A0A0B7ISU6_9PROT|nr:transcription antitermination factor NusB [Candidatus Methylopumilus turicensis]CEN55419.1 transcription antitermination protein [Candidatus Methylopumilus turicensis]